MTKLKGIVIENEDGDQIAIIDEVSSTLVVIPSEHHEQHEGNSYVYCELITLASAGVRDILIVTPDSTTLRNHFEYFVKSVGEANVKLYEGTTTSNDGTVLDPINRDRASANSPGTVITHSPTITGLGDLLPLEFQLGNAATGGGAKGGGENLRRAELLLDVSQTKYLLRVTSAQNSNDINICLDWYEHVDSTPTPPP